MSSIWPNGVPAAMPAQDRGDIQETFARYAWGIDLADKELALSAFTEDASFDHLWQDRKSTRLNSSHPSKSRMPSSA